MCRKQTITEIASHPVWESLGWSVFKWCGKFPIDSLSTLKHKQKLVKDLQGETFPEMLQKLDSWVLHPQSNEGLIYSFLFLCEQMRALRYLRHASLCF